MFEIKRETKHGKFHVVLNTDPEDKEIVNLAHMACSVLTQIEDEVKSADIKRKPQTKLGEYPVKEIFMGSYEEPSEGFKIQILSFAEVGKVRAAKSLRDATGISAHGCVDIIMGNYPCPILTRDACAQVMETLKKENINAIVKEVP